MLESGSFDIYKKITVPIMILDCLELDMEVQDTCMETVGSNECREVLEDNRDTNNILAIIQERERFSYKDKWKFIDPFVQSISGLYQISQLYLRTKEQKESSQVI